MDSNSPTSCSPCCSWWRLPLLLAFVLIAVMLMRGRGIWNAAPQVENDKATGAAAAAPTGKHVLLAIDFAVGRRQDFDSVAWHEGMTVADQLRAAPGVKIAQTGFGTAALLTAINDVANQGADGNNWTYQVNDQSADRSFEVYELHPDDRVLWTFGPPR